MAFRLQTSGDLRLFNNRREVVNFPEKGLLILAYLIAEREREVTRSRVARFIWGASDPARALTNLRQTAARISARQEEIGVRFLEFSASHVRLNTCVITSDLETLFALSNPFQSDIRERLARAISLYRVPFLSEVQNQPLAMQDWIAGKQREFADFLTSGIKTALPVSDRPEHLAVIKEAALRVFQNDPDNPTIRDLLRSAEKPAMVDEPSASVPSGIAAESILEKDVTSALGLLRTMFEKRHAEPRGQETEIALRSPVELAIMPRLAILPPGEGDGDTEGLVSALLEDITISLCNCKSMRIVAPYTAMRISRQSDKAELIARHAIAYVLDTRLKRMGSDEHLFAQLVYVPSDEVVWAERFPIDVQRFLLQRQEIVHRITSTISAQIEQNEASRRYFEDNPHAYYHYLQGQGHLRHLSLPEIRRARKAFRLSLQEKPDFGPALSGLSRTNHLEWLITARGEPELLKAAEVQAKQAIELCGELTFGYRELGVAKLFLGAFDESVDALLTAENLSPQYADVIADFGDTLIHASRPAEGLAKLKKAIELNPVTPDGYLWAAAGANYYLEEYSAALTYINGMADQTPALRLAAACNAMLGEQRQAKVLTRKVKEHYPDFDVDTWLSVLPIREEWQREHYRHGLKKAGL